MVEALDALDHTGGDSGSTGRRTTTAEKAAGAGTPAERARAAVATEPTTAAAEPAEVGPSAVARFARWELKERYDRDGFVAPLYALGPSEVAEALAGFMRFRDEHCHRLEQNGLTTQNHAWLPWLRDLGRHPAIVGAVAEVFRTRNVYLYTSVLLPRSPHRSQETEMGIGWHLDADRDFSRLQPVDRRHFVTAFVALTACDKGHGCLKVRPTRPGNWKAPAAPQLPGHGPPADGGCRGDAGDVVHLELQPGEFSLHGPSTPHTGGHNASGETRYCVGLRYIRASTRDSCHDDARGRDIAYLVSGRDERHNFDPMPEVPGEATEDGRQVRAEMLRRRGIGPTSRSLDGMVCA